LEEERGLVSLVKNILLGLGLNEVISYSLINRDLLEGLEPGKDSFIEILNPLSKEQEILRPTIIPGLLKSIAYNLNQKQNYINIFEIAKAFSAANASAPKEELVLGMALCGIKQWLSGQGQIKEEVGFLHLKGILETLFKRLGIEDYDFDMDSAKCASVLVSKEKMGVMTRLPKNVLDNFEIKNKGVFVAEISLERIFSYVKVKRKFMPLPKYPEIVRDISLIVKEDVAIKEILEAIQEKAGPLLRNIKITDYYKGKQIPAGFKGLTISCLYRSGERTLTETEINPLHTLTCAILEERFGAKIRQ
jgi:phenylalanyl-tRNA synthetase beta chain